MTLKRSTIITGLLIIAGLMIITPANATTYTDTFANLNGWIKTGSVGDVTISNGQAYAGSNKGILTATQYAATEWIIEGDITFASEPSGQYLRFGGCYNDGGRKSTIMFNPNANTITIKRSPTSTDQVFSYNLIATTPYHIKTKSNSTGFYLWVNGEYIGKDSTGTSSAITTGQPEFFASGMYGYLDNFYFNDQGIPQINDIYNLTTGSTSSTNKYNEDTILSINITRPNADGIHTSTIDYTILDGTAYYGTDFTGDAKTGTINFGASDKYKLINLTIKATPTYTGNRTFTFSITNPTNGVTLGTKNTTLYTIIDTGTNKPTFTMTVDKNPVGSGEQIIATLIPSIDTGFDEISYYSEDLELGPDPYSNIYQYYNWKNIGGNWCIWNGTAYDGAGIFDYEDAKKYGPQYGPFGNYRLHAKIFNAGSPVGETYYDVSVQVVSGNCSLSLKVKDINGNYIKDVDVDILDKNLGSHTILDLTNGYTTMGVPLYHDLGFTFTKTGYNTKIESKRFTASGQSYTVTMTYAGGDPEDAEMAYVSAQCIDITSRAGIPNVKIQLASGGVLNNKTVYTNANGYVQFEVYKNCQYVWAADADGYYGTTDSFTTIGNYEFTAEMWKIGDNPWLDTPTPTATARPAGQPLTDPEREAKANNMLDILFDNGEGIIYLCLIVLMLNLLGMMKTKKK